MQNTGSQIQIGPWMSRYALPDRAQVITVTPEMAGDWLDYRSRPGTDHQRKLSASRVNGYADQMARNLWRLTPQGLIFDTDGWMFNGQHRMQALRNAAQRVPGLEVDFWVFPNQPADLFPVIDVAYARQARQLYGGAHATLVTSSVRYLLPGRIGRYVNTLPPAEVLATVADWPEAVTHAAAVSLAANRTKIHGAAHLAVLAQAERTGARDKIGGWLEGITHGTGLAAGDPRLHLRERFMSSSRSVRMRSEMSYNLIAKAWNHHVEDKGMQVLSWRENEDTIKVIGFKE